MYGERDASTPQHSSHREMRRKDRAMSAEQTMALLHGGEYGVLSTVGEDGQPYGIPLSYCVIGEKLYFHGALQGQKLDNLGHEQRVSFCVVGETQPVYDGGFTTYYQSAVVFGAAGLVEDREEKTRALLALCEKYLPEHMDMADKELRAFDHTAVVAITMEHVTGKSKPRNKTGSG